MSQFDYRVLVETHPDDFEMFYYQLEQEPEEKRNLYYDRSKHWYADFMKFTEHDQSWRIFYDKMTKLVRDLFRRNDLAKSQYSFIDTLAKEGKVFELKVMAGLNPPHYPGPNGIYLAALNSKLDVLQWLYKKGKFDVDRYHFAQEMARVGKNDVLNWLNTLDK